MTVHNETIHYKFILIHSAPLHFFKRMHSEFKVSRYIPIHNIIIFILDVCYLYGRRGVGDRNPYRYILEKELRSAPFTLTYCMGAVSIFNLLLLKYGEAHF